MAAIMALTPATAVFAEEIPEENFDEGFVVTDEAPVEASEEVLNESFPAIEYAALAFPEVWVGETQGVVIGVDATAYSDAILKTVYEGTGEEEAYPASVMDNESVVFEIPNAKAGIKALKSLAFQLENGEYVEMSFADLGYEDVCYNIYEETIGEEADEFGSQIADVEVSETPDTAAISASVGAALSAGLSDTLSEERTNDGKVVIMLDPGKDDYHEGPTTKNQPGYRASKYNLKIGQYMAEYLSSYDKVIVTSSRNNTSCPSGGGSETDCINARVGKAINVKADLVISLHTNVVKNTKTRGVDIYFPNDNYNAAFGARGENYANHVANQLKKVGLSIRSLTSNTTKNAKYPDKTYADANLLIRQCKVNGIPAVVIEHGYMSNQAESDILFREQAIKAIGEADAQAVVDFFGLPKKTEEPETAPDRASISAFVSRLYWYCLERQPDAAGLEYWTNQLMNRNVDGITAAYGFFFSQEFENRNLSNEDFVESLYHVLMNRPSDAAGKADWVYKLENGVGRIGVYSGFANSAEYTQICSTYGIKKGELNVTGRNRNPGLTTFIARLYTKALGRPYDTAGLDYWCNEVLDGRMSIDDVSTIGFFTSPEFKNKGLTDGEYVTVLYHTFFDREPDQAGYTDWTTRLRKGTSRLEVLNGFAKSREFNALKQSYGIK